MAALMKRSGHVLNTRFLRTYAKERRVRDGGFYVLLPEIPPDTPETNPLLRINSYPQFSQIGPDKIVTGCAKAAIQYEVAVDDHVTKLTESDTERTFENVIAPVDKLNSDITFPFLTAKNLSYTKGGDFEKAFKRVHRQMYGARNGKWLSPAFYNLIKEVHAADHSLTESQRRLVELLMFDGRMAGLDATEEQEKRLLRSIRRLAEHRHDFRIRVDSCKRNFSHTITDFDVMSEMPKSVAKLFVDEGGSLVHGPWKVTLDKVLFNKFMEYCKDRTVRWSLHDAYVNMAGRRFISQNLENHVRIGDIREHKALIAQAHGYETYTDMLIVRQMASNVDNVLNMLEYYKSHFKDLATAELTSLQDFARESGFQVNLELCDLRYWRRKQRDHLFPHYNSPALWEYFPFQRVLTNTLDITSQLFGVTFEEHSDSVDVWDKHISFYKVFDTKSREYLGSFYLDPYQRPGKTPLTWSENGRERNGVTGVTPLMYIHLQLPLPVLPDQPVLMNQHHLLNFVEVFGNAMRYILDTCPLSELNTLTNMEYDAVPIVPKLFSKLLLSKPLLRQLSGHMDTGAAVPEELLDTFVRGRRHFQNYDIMEELYHAAFDLEINLTDEYWMDVKKKVWEEFLPIAHSMEDESPCAMNHVFADSSAGLGYSQVWSDMVASDLYKVFSDTGLEDLDKLTNVGLRFRENYLSYGNGLSGNEAFRRFTGRDPALESMVEYYSRFT